MDLLSVIRRWYFRDHRSIREISRQTKLSRNTIRKYLKNSTVEPKYPERRSASKLTGFEAKLEQWLTTEPNKPKKLRRNLKSMHRDLVSLGFTGSYDRVCAFARQWKQKERFATGQASKHCYIPLQFQPGEAFQFDWSEDIATIAGKQVKLQIAQFRLPCSRAFTLRAYHQQKQEMLFDAHWHAFRIFNGVPARGIYDNMKTAVDSIGRGKDRKVNSRFSAMCSHYLFDASFCSPASGWEKGQIEKNVQDVRQLIWQSAPSFKTLEDLNVWLEQRCQLLWHELKHPQTEQTIAQALTDEQLQLMTLPQPFDGYAEYHKRVTSTCLVHHDGNRYSVPACYANQVITLLVYADQLVFTAQGQEITKHTRSFDTDHTYFDWQHYLSVLQRKPGALRNGAPFQQLPKAFKELQTILLKRTGGDREMVEILSLVLHYETEAVLTAVELALEYAQTSKEHVLNLLNRLTEQLPQKPILIPDHLQLEVEPQANMNRYDALRSEHHAT